MRRSKPIGHIADCAVETAQRIADRAHRHTDSDIKQFTVWTDLPGNVYAARADAASAMQAEISGELIGIYLLSAGRRFALRTDLIADDLREEQRLRALKVAA